ncbi:hypothetical protein CAPTEDRAFT_212311 [Capitella teleta]|uniref:Uncharacterized protein n=1 Tax=Capitella teleta TaxID=283909 RepID=R7VFQ3_CAPTE|nr:hypothetical protein CAPTEDRAFT_212311 [Capitella teleta]|eukprot:ELU14510.1 hypothetical protein CAPTEDRAFT_212311 [Capitella teleta]
MAASGSKVRKVCNSGRPKNLAVVPDEKTLLELAKGWSLYGKEYGGGGGGRVSIAWMCDEEEEEEKDDWRMKKNTPTITKSTPTSEKRMRAVKIGVRRRHNAGGGAMYTFRRDVDRRGSCGYTVPDGATSSSSSSDGPSVVKAGVRRALFKEMDDDDDDDDGDISVGL